jgi:hypothetical protein
MRYPITPAAQPWRESPPNVWRLAIAIFVLSVFGVVLWDVVEAPPILGFGLAAGMAMSWCFWLDGHPEDAENR